MDACLVLTLSRRRSRSRAGAARMLRRAGGRAGNETKEEMDGSGGKDRWVGQAVRAEIPGRPAGGSSAPAGNQRACALICLSSPSRPAPPTEIAEATQAVFDLVPCRKYCSRMPAAFSFGRRRRLSNLDRSRLPFAFHSDRLVRTVLVEHNRLGLELSLGPKARDSRSMDMPDPDPSPSHHLHIYARSAPIWPRRARSVFAFIRIDDECRYISYS